MKQRFSWEAISFSAILEISTILWNLFPMFITIFTTACYLSVSWARWIQLAYSVHFSLRSTLAMQSRPPLGLPNGLFPSGSPSNPHLHFSAPPQTHCCTILPSTHLQLMYLLIMQFSLSPCHFLFSYSNRTTRQQAVRRNTLLYRQKAFPPKLNTAVTIQSMNTFWVQRQVVNIVATVRYRASCVPVNRRGMKTSDSVPQTWPPAIGTQCYRTDHLLSALSSTKLPLLSTLSATELTTCCRHSEPQNWPPTVGTQFHKTAIAVGTQCHRTDHLLSALSSTKLPPAIGTQCYRTDHLLSTLSATELTTFCQHSVPQNWPPSVNTQCHRTDHLLLALSLHHDPQYTATRSSQSECLATPFLLLCICCSNYVVGGQQTFHLRGCCCCCCLFNTNWQAAYHGWDILCYSVPSSETWQRTVHTETIVTNLVTVYYYHNRLYLARKGSSGMPFGLRTAENRKTLISDPRWWVTTASWVSGLLVAISQPVIHNIWQSINSQ